MNLQSSQRLLVGVVHLRPLPGAPGFDVGAEGSEMSAVLEAASRDARALARGGADAIIVENFGDAPFFPGAVEPCTLSAMTRAVLAVSEALESESGAGVALGVNVLRNDARACLALCASTPASFLRVNVHIGAAVTDQGIVEGRAHETLRERARLAPTAQILADVHVKHAQPLGGGPIEDAALETFERGNADALIVSGTGTGAAPDVQDLKRVRATCPQAPVLIGSGLTLDNAPELMPFANGAIVGTSIKRAGRVSEPVDADRVRALRDALDALR